METLIKAADFIRGKAEEMTGCVKNVSIEDHIQFPTMHKYFKELPKDVVDTKVDI
jgi:hypothetical protein